jgi:energy-coupling factor transport system ATP-binding protein
VITVSNLTYRYPGSDRPALRDVTLEFSPGESVALMGSNGSGKSTLARCLNGLLVPQEGAVTVDGQVTSDPSLLPSIRRTVGLVFQRPANQMTSPTVERELAFGLENLGVAPERMRAEVEGAIGRLGFERCRHLSPGHLSGGEQQRLALAAVMLLQPRYLILDEAASLLAGSSRAELLEDIRRLVRERGRGLIMITQSARDAAASERLIVLHQGAVVADGTPAFVFKRAPGLRELGVPVPLRSLFDLPA